MRLYLDQMLKAELADMLASQGHDVVRSSDVGQSRAEDDAILVYANAENRILITLDDDFGNWAILPLHEHHGVIRIKVHPPTSARIAEVLTPFLRDVEQRDLMNRLVILSEKRARWIQTA
ncbi:MAG: DUF5615 family PIN-like protein [Candidatus Omnitrophica bacterium]|nr:DUF5615 family PIN-like protein [Candidatus Omnitrophota bacterium]